MIKYIKSILTCLTVGLAFVSCNNNFDDDVSAINYPQKLELGMWKSIDTGGTTSYTVNITLNEAGDTICDVTVYNSATGIANVLDGGDVSYDSRIGMMTADYATSMYEELPARVTMTWKNDLKEVTVCLYSMDEDVDEEGQSVLVPSSEGVFSAERATTISVLGDWTLADGSTLTLNSDGTAELLEGTTTTAGTYTFDGTTGTVTLNDGKTISLTLNEKGQMSASVNGAEAAYTAHTMTPPVDDWYDYADGIYTSWLFGDYPPSVLEYSPSRRAARIRDTYVFGWELRFYWNIGAEDVTFTKKRYRTYYEHTQDGQNLGEVYFIPTALDATGAQARFQNNVFTFGISYQIPGAGTFGSGADTFTITNLVE